MLDVLSGGYGGVKFLSIFDTRTASFFSAKRYLSNVLSIRRLTEHATGFVVVLKFVASRTNVFMIKNDSSNLNSV